MPPVAFLRGWLHILLPLLFLSLSVGTFFNLNPDLNVQGIGPLSSFLGLCDTLIERWSPEWRPGLEVQETSLLLLYITSIVTVWIRVFSVNYRMCKITEHYIQRAQQCSTKMAMLENGIKGLKRFQKTMEQKQRLNQQEIESLTGQLESMAKNLQEKESALKKELAQMEATDWTKSEGILKEAEECQNPLENKVQFQKREEQKAHEDMVAYHRKEMALARERSKPADQHPNI